MVTDIWAAATIFTYIQLQMLTKISQGGTGEVSSEAVEGVQYIHKYLFAYSSLDGEGAKVGSLSHRRISGLQTVGGMVKGAPANHI